MKEELHNADISEPEEMRKREGKEERELGESEERAIPDNRRFTRLRRIGGAGRSATKSKRLHPLRPSPLHNEHFWVFGGCDTNEPGHTHQTIHPLHRPGSLLSSSKLV